MLDTKTLTEIASALNRLGPDRSRGVVVEMINGTRITAYSFQVVGSLLMAVLDPAKPRESYALVNPGAVAAYVPGEDIKESSAA